MKTSTGKRAIVGGLVLLALGTTAFGAALPGQGRGVLGTVPVARAECEGQSPPPLVDCTDPPTPTPTPTPGRE